MEYGENKKMDELLELERDNNRMLHKMRRSMVWSSVFTFLYWLVILGGVGASYYYLQPYVVKYWNIYQSTMKTLESIEQTGKSLPTDFSALLEKVR